MAGRVRPRADPFSPSGSDARPGSGVRRRSLRSRDAVQRLLRIHPRRPEGELDRRGRLPPVAEGRQDFAGGPRPPAQGASRRAIRRRPRKAEPLVGGKFQRHLRVRPRPRRPRRGRRELLRPRARSDDSSRRARDLARRLAIPPRSSGRLQDPHVARDRKPHSFLPEDADRKAPSLAGSRLLPSDSSSLCGEPPSRGRRFRDPPASFRAAHVASRAPSGSRRLPRSRGPPPHGAAPPRLRLAPRPPPPQPLLLQTGRVARRHLRDRVAPVPTHRLRQRTGDAPAHRQGRDRDVVAHDRAHAAPGSRRHRRRARRARGLRRQPHGHSRRRRHLRRGSRFRSTEEHREPPRRLRRPRRQDHACRRRRPHRDGRGHDRGRDAHLHAHAPFRPVGRHDSERHARHGPDRKPEPARQVPRQPHPRAPQGDDGGADAGGSRRNPPGARRRSPRREGDASRALPEARASTHSTSRSSRTFSSADYAAYLEVQEQLLFVLLEIDRRGGNEPRVPVADDVRRPATAFACPSGKETTSGSSAADEDDADVPCFRPLSSSAAGLLAAVASGAAKAPGIFLLVCGIPVFAVSATRHLLRGLLWRVGSRLAVSYLLLLSAVVFATFFFYAGLLVVAGQLGTRRVEAALEKRRAAVRRLRTSWRRVSRSRETLPRGRARSRRPPLRRPPCPRSGWSGNRRAGPSREPGPPPPRTSGRGPG